MKLLAIFSAAVPMLFASCETPVNLSYTGAAAGHRGTVGYGTQTGFVAAIEQK